MDSSETAQHISHPITVIFDGSNYDLWSQEMCSFLKGRLLWRYVTGEIPKPAKISDETEDKFAERIEKWDGKNHQILTRFHNTCIASIKLEFRRYDSSKECEPEWDSTSVATTYSKLRNRQRVWHLLMTLRDEYEPISSTLLYHSPLPSLDVVINDLLSEETHLKTLRDERSLLSTDVVLATPGTSATSSTKSPKRTFYNYCKKTGHTISECRRLQAKKTSGQKSSSMGSLASSSTAAAATENTSDNTSPKFSLRELQALLYQLQHDSGIPSKSVLFVTPGTVSTSCLSLPNTFLVPQLSLNLISVGQLCELGFEIHFSSRGCTVHDPQTGKIIGTNRKVGRLFELSSLQLPSLAAVVTSSFSTMIKTQFSSIIKIFRTDNAMEYKDSVLIQFLSQNGTIIHRSCPGTSQQNGRVERKHKHILDIVRALLISSSCPERFWGETALIAVYTINRIPSPVIGNISPYERLYGHCLDYQSLHVFGCACFVLLQPHEHTKSEPKARLCCFLGYGIEHKGYRCWDPLSQQLRISRHVTFWEHKIFSSLSPFRVTTTSSHFFTDPTISLFPDDLPAGPTTSSSNSSNSTAQHATSPDASTLAMDPPSLPSSEPLIPPDEFDPAHSDVSLCHSGRVTKPSILLCDFHCYSTIVSLYEPCTYREASTNPLWQKAMTEEI
ncbi:PREDICTED: uncharacterized protein LOC104601921 [Nelumbo nucifera]|uniref:Uncharacterized protein LOC104601921 n=1 Tax=Nelumbo nucifera TaxID=4432 RepID=A0A1U8AMQ4_NELNU|nr:PREDICTED: uncharacterized protein LOC104601921 [Nelumbo nucifera]